MICNRNESRSSSLNNANVPPSVYQTIQNIKSDIKRMRELMNVTPSFSGTVFLLLSPSIMAMHLYRWSFYLYSKHLHAAGRLIWLFNHYLTGADISPESIIGPGCYIGHPVGTVITGKLGTKVSLFGSAILGGGCRDESDIGGGAGLPLVGNNVFIGVNTTILGAIRIGDGAQVGACSLVLEDIPPGKLAFGNPAKVRDVKPIDYEKVAGITKHE